MIKESYYDRNRDKILIKNKKYYADHREEQVQRIKTWESNNVEYRRTYKKEWYAKKKAKEASM